MDPHNILSTFNNAGEKKEAPLFATIWHLSYI